MFRKVLELLFEHKPIVDRLDKVIVEVSERVKIHERYQCHDQVRVDKELLNELKYIRTGQKM